MDRTAHMRTSKPLTTHSVEISVQILKLTSDDLDAIDDLMKRNSRTLGFLLTEALTDYIHKGRT